MKSQMKGDVSSYIIFFIVLLLIALLLIFFYKDILIKYFSAPLIKFINIK